jgi:antitoxin VapB
MSCRELRDHDSLSLNALNSKDTGEARIGATQGLGPYYSIAMNTQRKVKLFRNGRNQAVRIRRAFELPGEDAVMRKEGDRLVIETGAPSGPNARLSAVLAALQPLSADDAFPTIEDGAPGAVPL